MGNTSMSIWIPEWNFPIVCSQNIQLEKWNCDLRPVCPIVTPEVAEAKNLFVEEYNIE